MGLALIVISLYLLPLGYYCIGYSDKIREKMDLGLIDIITLEIIAFYLFLDLFVIFHLTVTLLYYVIDMRRDVVERSVEISCKKLPI
jgi:hypothetical protein